MDVRTRAELPVIAMRQHEPPQHTLPVNWTHIARLVLTSRTLDDIEEHELVPSGKVKYQFSARGHELAQVLLGLHLTHPHDAATVYYRSRPFMLAAGLMAEEALATSMANIGGISGGRDVGTVFSMPSRGGATVLPMTGDVGGQYTPAAGWAQTICYRTDVLRDSDWHGAVAVVLGGDGSTATPGFWSALNIATANALPLLFFIEDNGYAISVPSTTQMPGGSITANLAAYNGLRLLDGDGTDPHESAELIIAALDHIRAGRGPVLLRLRVPRLNGHSFTDNQAYKDETLVAAEWARDPLPRLRAFLLEEGWTQRQWDDLADEVERDVRQALERASSHDQPDPTTTTHHLFSETARPCRDDETTTPIESGARINMVDAIRLTLAHEMKLNYRMLIFGEDVGKKGGVHGATRDLQSQFGVQRVFDTSLSEEGIIGRAVGMAYAGLLPVPEIQFRKYVAPAIEQIEDCGTVRWRTNNRFAAPMVIRMPVGFSKVTGDVWHSVSGEAIFAHTLGWRIIMPSNAADAVGLLRTALRSGDPTFFLEHRARLDTPEGRRPYPGDNYVIPLGKAAICQTGNALTVVTWGAMVHRCIEAARPFGDTIEIIDLRTICPWDKDAVLESVRKTGRCLVVHEDTITAGFGAEILAVVGQEAFSFLDAPLARIAAPDCPVPYNARLTATVIPAVERIRIAIEDTLRY